MPFKLKLKKSKHYSVASKSLFVISVEILDGTTVECTLSSESTGQDCLDIVSQKLSLNQPKFFGLQYIRKNDNNLYWLELDRPLKRQLDKYARTLCVYLRVMYYIISGVRLINDEVTRYHYFLQLKMDVIEGRISCTPQQAIELASFSMQAEFGNFDLERHTAPYLKDFQLFPKTFTDPGLLDSLTDAASRQHAALHNLPQGTAEEYYICACQQLEGYGQEMYSVKDRQGDDAVISVSLTEVCVEYSGKMEGRRYAWSDIKNVINHKRDFTIETVYSEKVEFHFPDVESAKNAWRFCVLQHTFYQQYEKNNDDQGQPQPPVFQQADLRQMDSYDDITDSQHWDSNAASTHSLNNLKQRAQSSSCLDLNKQTNNIDQLRSLLPSYRPAPDYETAIQHKYRNSSSAIPREPIRTATPHILYSSHPEIHQSHLSRFPDVIHHHGNALEQRGNSTNDISLLYKPPPPYPNSNRLNSNSTPDLAGMSHFTNYNKAYYIGGGGIVSGSSPDLVSGAGNLYHHYLRHLPLNGVSGPGQTGYAVHRSQSFLPPGTPHHGTYENLSSIFGTRQHVLLDPSKHGSGNIKKVYDEHGNIIFCMPVMNMKGFVVATSAATSPTEPIYENIPLPVAGWQHEGMRARTQSIHSAPPEIVNHTVVNAMQAQMKQLHLAASNPDTEPTYYANIVEPMAGRLEPLPKVDDSSSSLSNLRSESPTSNHTFIVNGSSGSDKNASVAGTSSSTLMMNNSGATLGFNESGAPTVVVESFNDTTTSVSSASSKSSTKSKKRWGILMGRSKSSDKVKSATLGRDNAKAKEKSQSGGNIRHRWSTGLPKFNPLPPSISKETMCQLLENKLADSQLFFEFDKIPKKKQNGDFSTASHRDNAAFNRFKDVLPYEDNRVRLTPTKGNKFGYINASHITATVGSKQRFYIAAQGPTRLTLPYFWQCVWEAEVYLIVQLTDSSEDLNYMPDVKERCIDISPEFQVWWEFSQTSDTCVTSKVRLCHVTSRRYRTLWHMQYTEWGDQGCPQTVSHFKNFLEEMQSVQQHSMGEIPPGHNKNPPILVHCTAGVGRTGLTILSDLLLYTVNHNQEVCIPRVVELLRHQRAYMIQIIAQYR